MSFYEFSVNISLFERKNDMFAGAVYTGDFYVAFAASSTSDFCHCQVASSFKHVGNLMTRCGKIWRKLHIALKFELLFKCFVL